MKRETHIQGKYHKYDLLIFSKNNKSKKKKVIIVAIKPFKVKKEIS